jgi:alpha-ribazole phosphatase
MKLEFALIRHGRDSGGRLGGVEDKPMSDFDKRFVRQKAEKGDYPEVELVFSSGLTRCRDTARIIYPKLPAILLKELIAPDIGLFEGQSVSELKGREMFEEWAALTEVREYPGGESPYLVSARAVEAFRLISQEMLSKGLLRVAVISHKAVILAILQRFYVPRSNYVDWHIPHGGGYLLRYDTFLSHVEIIAKI